jgi:hypothetical protein
MWKVIPETDGRYEASTEGKIRSVGFYKQYRSHRQWNASRELSPSDNLRGYLQCVLYIKGKPKTFKVHRLVASAFLANKENLPQINHKDKNRKNNCVENLEWCTASKNVEHSFSKSYKLTNLITGEALFTNNLSATGKQLGFYSANAAKVLKGKRSHTNNWYIERV